LIVPPRVGLSKRIMAHVITEPVKIIV